MFQNAFQSGTHLEIFHPKIDKDKEKKLFRVTNPSSLSKVFDRTTRGYIYDLDRGLKPSLHFPASDKQDLGIIQPILTFQAYFPAGEHFTIEVTITNTTKSKRRFHFSTTTRQLELTYFHARIPLDMVKRDTWINLSFDMMSFLELFKGQTFRTIDAFSIGGVCKIRRIFTLKQFPNDSSPTANEDTVIPKTQNFGSGVPHANQLLTLDMITKNQQIIENNNSSIQEPNNLAVFGMALAPLAENKNLKPLVVNHRRVRSSAKDAVNNSVELPLPSQRIFRNQRNSVVDKENIRQNVPISSAVKPRVIEPIMPVRHSVQNFMRKPSIDDIDLLNMNDEIEWKNIPTPMKKEEKIDPLQEIQIQTEATPRNNFYKEEENVLKTEENNEKLQQRRRSMKEIPKSALFEKFFNRKTETSNASIHSNHPNDQETSVEIFLHEGERESSEKKKEAQPPRINKWFQNVETPIKTEERKINTAEKKEKEEISNNGFFSERGAYMINKPLEIDHTEGRLPSIWENVLGGFLSTPKGDFSIPPLVQQSPKIKEINHKETDKSVEELNWETEQLEERAQMQIPENESEESCEKVLSLNEDDENEAYDMSENVPLQIIEKSAYLEPEIVEQDVSEEENIPYDTEKEEHEVAHVYQEESVDSQESGVQEPKLHESYDMKIRTLSQGGDMTESHEESLDSRGSEIREEYSAEKPRSSHHSDQIEVRNPFKETRTDFQEDSLDSRGSDIESAEKPRDSHWYSVKSDFGGWSTQRKVVTGGASHTKPQDSHGKKQISFEEKKESFQLQENQEQKQEENSDKSSELDDSLEFMISKYVCTGAKQEITEGEQIQKNAAQTLRLEKEDFRSPPLGPSMVDDEFSYQGMEDSSDGEDERDENYGNDLDETDFGIMKTLQEEQENGDEGEIVGGSEMEVVYDPVWKCYYHPRTNSYFELK